MNRKDIRFQNLSNFGLLMAIIIVSCYIASFVFFRIDLTQEKRYTVSEVSKQVLKSVPDEVLIKIYLEGDLPTGFKRLNKSVHEILDEFRVYAGKNIQYQFIDPYENTDKNALRALIKDLYDKGLQPTNVKIKDQKGGYSEKLVIPGALISYNRLELPINLLSNNPGLSGEENLNNSIQGLEFTLINSIHCITKTKLEKIAFLEGQGELDQYQTGDIMRELANYYQVDRGQINGVVNSLKDYKCVVIAKPEKAFSEEDKFVLDQYAMNGGKILWFIDAVHLDADSIAKGKALASIQQLNIDDQLFKYGIRINPVLIEDVQCSLIPVNTSMNGPQPKFVPAPWLYFPLLSGSPLHPLSRNINLVKSEYCSYIDPLVANGKLKKTVLLQSSKFSRLHNVPDFVSLSEVKQQHQQSDFDKSFLPVSVLIEGKFPSVFENRMLSGLKLTGNFNFKKESVPTKMLVVADGDIIRNDIKQTAQGTMLSPLGLDKYTSQTFGNKEFVLNAVNYLAGEDGIMQLRTREVKLRLLDKPRLQEEKMKWQLINVAVPLVIVLILGIGITFWRKKKFAF